MFNHVLHNNHVIIMYKFVFNAVTEATLQRCSMKRCPENMHQVYRRAPMPKWVFNKVALLLLRIFRTHFLRTLLEGCFCSYLLSYIRPKACNFIKKETLAQVFFPVNFAKFLRASFLQKTSWRLLLYLFWHANDPIVKSMASVTSGFCLWCRPC